MNEKKHFELILRVLNNEASDEEKNQFDVWINSNEENKEYFESVRNSWENFSEEEIDVKFDKDKGWKLLENKYQFDTNTDKTKIYKLSDSVSKFTTNNMIKLAAASVLIFASILIYQLVIQQSYPLIYENLTAEVSKVKLDDGTVVNLSPDSKLEIPEAFSEEMRKTKIEGKLFFDVVSDKRKFIIETENAFVEILGTQFEVFSDDNKTTVIVSEGKVSLSNSLSPEDKIYLTENEKGECISSNPPEKLKRVNANQLVSWISGNIVFHRHKLHEIAEILSGIYKTKIILDDEEIKDLTLHAVFAKDEEISKIIDEICLSLNLKAEIKDDVIHISKK